MANKSTLSDYLAELGVDINNMQEFLNKLSLMLTTTSDTVAINQTLQDGTAKTFTVPSFAYLKNKINTIDDKFNSLLTGNANRIGLVDENGQLRNFELQDLSQVVTDLDSVASKTVATPSTFNYRTNWFFESFLNPLIYVDLPVDSLATTDIDKFEVKRVIMTSQVQTDKDYFDSTYKGQNNIVYSNLLKDLNTRAIQYFEDTNEVGLPPTQNKKIGSFDVLNILSDSTSKVVLGQAVVTTVNRYVLNTLKYNEKSASAANGLVQKTLAVNDYLITADNSEYKVTAVDADQTSVILTRTFGLGELAIGASILRIKPQLDPINTLSVNLGYNERQVLFFKPISSRLKVTTDNYSQGVGLFSNELTLTLAEGQSMTLEDFYKQFVSDFGLLFLSYAKEKKLPSSLGEVPNAAVLETSSFKVVQVDQHIRESDDIAQVKQNISSIEQVKSQIKEVDRQISEKRAELNVNANLSQAQQLKLTKDLSTLSDQRKTLTTQQSSKVSSVTTAIKATPVLTATPAYMIKGFWHIPDPKITEHGVQNVVQFKVSYRVLSKTGTTEKAEQITFTDPKGNRVVGSFSPWKEVLSKVRQKVYNAKTGFYEWAAENAADPNVVNINQIELPIAKGQVVEIRVKSLSEAGYPDSPIESSWSNSVLVEFPASLQSPEDISVISQQAFAEETRIGFQDELNAKGLDLHLGTAFTSRDKYYAHKTEDIASGFFASDGSIVDLFTKLKSISDSLTAIQTSIASGTGQLKVSILDQAGNQIEVTNGQTVNIFAGYYKDQIKNNSTKTVTYDHGKIITAQYYIQLENTSQTSLELISALTGGIGEIAPTSNPVAYASDVYHTGLRYDFSPITIANATPGLIGDIRQLEGYQSSQVKGQFLYRRTKSINLADSLVVAETPTSTADAYNTTRAYSYSTGYSIGTTVMPYSSGHYVPFEPTASIGGATTAASVWNGSIESSSGAPKGGGYLTEFCISIDHADIKSGGKFNNSFTNIKYPTYSSTSTIQNYLPFSHGVHFEIAESDSANALGAKYFQQAAYLKPLIPSPLTASLSEANFPIKNSFSTNDKYLIGKYTCGAYFFIAPASHQSIGATSVTPSAAKAILKYGTGSSIKVPLTFQYRCSDYLKYIGGYRKDSPTGLRNVKYTKKVGFDIGLKNDTFSFDVQISAQYEKETAVITPATAVSQTATVATAALGA
jgi:hypothetical protein